MNLNQSLNKIFFQKNKQIKQKPSTSQQSRPKKVNFKPVNNSKAGKSQLAQTYPLLEQLSNAGIIGRGGAGFPTDKKWLRLKELGQQIGYVVCNASEGEIGVKKDLYVLEHYPDMVVLGMVTAMDFLGTKEAYFNINKNYFEQVGQSLKKVVAPYEKKDYKFHFFIEEPSYIGGETGALLNAIEGKRTQPRLKPPSPSIAGIFGKPVLVNNVETFYDVARVVDGSFKPSRFVTIIGPVKHSGVFELNRQSTVAEALKQTDNYPDFAFFAQVGGSASGEVINQEQAANYRLTGCGSVEVYGADAQPYDVLMRWFEFYYQQSCGKCTPCREGTYQLYSMLKNLQFGQPIPWEEIKKINQLLKETSFCDLGRSLPIPVVTYMKNVLRMEV